jgi:hypothetical protein
LPAPKPVTPELVDAVTVAVTPAASVPLVDDKVTHEATFDAVQFIEAVPVFLSVYIWLTGVYVLPTVHDEVRPPAGVTVSGPATDAVVTVRLTARVVFPVPLVALVKVTVSV